MCCLCMLFCISTKYIYKRFLPVVRHAPLWTPQCCAVQPGLFAGTAVLLDAAPFLGDMLLLLIGRRVGLWSVLLLEGHLINAGMYAGRHSENVYPDSFSRVLLLTVVDVAGLIKHYVLSYIYLFPHTPRACGGISVSCLGWRVQICFAVLGVHTIKAQTVRTDAIRPPQKIDCACGPGIKRGGNRCRSRRDFLLCAAMSIFAFR